MTIETLSLVPDWRGDETLYSLSVRLHRLRGAGPPRDTGMALFATPHAYKEWGAPTRIHRFCEVTGQMLGDVRTILLERTVLAAYYPFLRTDQRSLFDQKVQSGERTAWLTRFGMRASTLDVTVLRCCKYCVQEDLDTLGTARWRLPHQLPGAWWCLEHACLLDQHLPQQAAWIVPDVSSAPVESSSGNFHSAPLHAVAALAHSLIGTTMLNLPMIKRALLSALREQSVVSNGKPISVPNLRQWFATTPIAKALPHVEPGLNRLLDGEWIYQILLKRRACHPLLWMILWAAVFDHLDTAELILGFRQPEHLLAWDEDGQGMLWIEEDIRADARVREIVLKSTTVQDAAEQLQVSAAAIRRYMRRAQCSPRGIRDQARRDARQLQAVDEIERLIQSMPALTRSDIHCYCKSAVSWLRRWSPELLDSLLMRVPEVRRKQLEMFSTT